MSVEIGVFEAQGLSGGSLAAGAAVMGIRLAAPHPAMGLFDDKDVLLTLGRPDLYAPDLSYVRYDWRVPVTRAALRAFARTPIRGNNSPLAFVFGRGDAAQLAIEWQAVGGVVQGRYTSDRAIEVALLANGCFAPARVTACRRDGCTLSQGGRHLRLRLAGAVTGVYRVDTRRDAEIVLLGPGARVAGTDMAVYRATLAPRRPLYFAAALDGAHAPALRPAAVASSLRRAAARYARTRMRAGGLLPGSAQAVAALAGYSRVYDPSRRRVQATVNRTWAGPNTPGIVFGWDNFFLSYLASWENPRFARESLEHILSVYGERGIARGPAQRNLIIPVLYGRTLDVLNDDALARRTWPVMMAFMRFWFADRGDGVAWRDGNGDGLIESGASAPPDACPLGERISQAMDETGYDDIPIYSEGFTDGRRGFLARGVRFDARSQNLTVTLVCQNSLYVAACRKMGGWARRLGRETDAAWLAAEAERVSRRMRTRLFHPRLGIFRDRFWSGRFSPVKAVTQFYPLLADLCDDDTRARLRRSLLDPGQFGGASMAPTVSRDDPTYCDSLDGRGNYWRGNCWPPTTYIVYLAAKEAGWDDIAATLARRAHAQFMPDWRRLGHAYENYPAEGPVDHGCIYPGGPWGGREVRYAWAGLLPMCGLEELFAPEAAGDGVRFGNPWLAGEARWDNFRFAGAAMSAVAGPARTEVRSGAGWQFLAQPGVAVRHFVRRAGSGGLEAHARQRARVRLRLGGAAAVADWRVCVNGAPVTATHRNGTLAFDLPAGRSRICWQNIPD